MYPTEAEISMSLLEPNRKRMLAAISSEFDPERTLTNLPKFINAVVRPQKFKSFEHHLRMLVKLKTLRRRLAPKIL